MNIIEKYITYNIIKNFFFLNTKSKSVLNYYI